MAKTIFDKFTEERLENERQLLGGLLTQSALAYRAAAAVVAPEHFVDQFNGYLFQLIGEATDAGLVGSERTQWLLAQIKEIPSVEQAKETASAIYASYVSAAAPLIGLDFSARMVRHDHLKACLQTAMAQNNLSEVAKLATEMEKLRAAQRTADESVERIGQLSQRVLEKLNEAHMADEPVNDFAYCGSGDLGDLLGGWRRKRFYVIAGRPGMGKSTVALSLLLKTAAKGHGVMFFALEMGREELTEMALANLAWSYDHRIEYRDIMATAVRREGFSEKFERVLQVAPKLNDMPLFIGDRGGLTLAEVRSQALTYAQRLAAEGKRLEVIVVDHMGLMKASDRYAGNKVSETEEISNGLKALAKELDVAVIALAQISRGVEGRDDKRPQMSDLRWSGSIEQDADIIAFVYREAYYLERLKHDNMDDEEQRVVRLGEMRSRIEVLISKHRGGPCGAVEMFCDMGCAVVRDIAVVGL